MEKYSVIIPTLWYSKRTDKLLNDLIKSDDVGEIIIIDNNNGFNNQNLSIKNLDKEFLSKLKIFPQEKNIYVNPAWNLGVKHSKYENICLCNDDINFDPSIFKLVNKHINLGVIGVEKSNFKMQTQEGFTPEIIKSHSRQTGWGCLMFIRKDKWIDIPNELKIFCGDDLLYYFVEGGPYYIRNFKITGEFSTSVVKPEFRAIEARDITLFKDIRRNFKR